MSFWIYKTDGARALRLSPVRLTGLTGLLAQFLREHAREETPFTWQLLSQDIIALAAPELDPARHLVVIDLLPESFTEICLYRVTHLQGVSEVDETELVVAFKILAQGPAQRSAEIARLDVELGTIDEGRNLLEAFRLTGGTMSGRYAWARPKMDIGAAVCAKPVYAPTH